LNIEEELISFLTNIQRNAGQPRLDGTPRKTRDQDPHLKQRDIDIVLSYFGFGSDSELPPTYDELAARNEVTKQRIEQVIDRGYTEYLGNQQLPKAKAIADVLARRRLWLESEYLAELQVQGLIGTIRYAAGLLRYLDSQALAGDYGIFLPDLSLATRTKYLDYDERFIALKQKIAELKEDFKLAEGAGGQVGLAKISDVIAERPNVDIDYLSALILSNKRAWSTRNGDDLWYSFEDRINVLVNHAAKTFAVTPICPLDGLSEVLANSLARRTRKLGYPDAAMIRTWITQSKHFAVRDGLVSSRIPPAQLTPIEELVVELTRGKGATLSGPLIQGLTARGFGDALAAQIVRNSPLIYVDRSGGRPFKFTLVSDLAGAHTPTKALFYEQIRQRLDNLSCTDRDANVSVRREQPILAEWVFANDAYGECAICGRRFGVGALVVAHKKKRMHCTDFERLDPYIVFPLCIFGCDYLYENGFVTVRSGVVIAGHEVVGETERDVVSCLTGRVVPSRWTQGPTSYFDNLIGRTSVGS
jgi:hypothetical protein